MFVCERSKEHLDVSHQVLVLAVIMDDEVSIKAFGGRAQLLLGGGAVANTGTVGALLHLCGGWGLAITWETQEGNAVRSQVCVCVCVCV